LTYKGGNLVIYNVGKSEEKFDGIQTPNTYKCP